MIIMLLSYHIMLSLFHNFDKASSDIYHSFGKNAKRLNFTGWVPSSAVYYQRVKKLESKLCLIGEVNIERFDTI